jgi:hypothetical protein
MDGKSFTLLISTLISSPINPSLLTLLSPPLDPELTESPLQSKLLDMPLFDHSSDPSNPEYHSTIKKDTSTHPIGPLSLPDTRLNRLPISHT